MSIDPSAPSAYVSPGLPERPLRGKVIGFTGTRRPLAHPQAELVITTLTGLRKIRGFVTGGCTGIDTSVGRWLAWVYPQVPQIVFLPADRSRVVNWWDPLLADWDAEEEGRPAPRIVAVPVPGSYADRNAAIVAKSDVVVGFPAYAEQHPARRRSGSWQTLRMARSAGLVTHPIVLETKRILKQHVDHETS